MRTSKAESQSQNHSTEPKVLDNSRRLKQETVTHDWQRKMPWTNPRDKTAGNRFSKLVKVSRVGKYTDQFPIMPGSILTNLI